VTAGPAPTVKAFLDVDWPKKAKRFVVAVACVIHDPKVVDEIERTHIQLKQQGIAFSESATTRLSSRTKSQFSLKRPARPSCTG
jgi:hypothetical protein